MNRDSTANDQLILAHYKTVAVKHGSSSRSSMEDDLVREREVEWIRQFFLWLRKRSDTGLRVLDLGCGNGHALQVLADAAGTQDQFWGLDFSEDLLAIARGRRLPNCEFTQGDARRLSVENEFFDLVYTERCLINILDWSEQKAALQEVARVLKRGGYYLAIECFLDGLENNNKARAECGLPDIKQAHHNRYFQMDLFRGAIRGWFTIIDPSQLQCDCFTFQPNFLSSHYFVSRVLYPAITKGDIARNSEVAKFFSFLPPMGNYSPIQAYVLMRL